MTEETKDNLDTLDQDGSGVTTESEETASTDEATDERLAKLEENYKNQKIRAEKAEKERSELEAKLKAASESLTEEKKEEAPEESQTQLSREEAILYAKGHDQEVVDKLNKIAQVEGVGLLEAEESDIFKTWDQNRKAQAESESAELGTSKGSPRKGKKADLSTPGLSKDDHEALWKKQFGR